MYVQVYKHLHGHGHGHRYDIDVVRDTTVSHMNVDRGPIHVIESNNNLFSWRKYNNYTLILILYNLLQGAIRECNRFVYTYTMFSLCWLLTAVSHLQ